LRERGEEREGGRMCVCVCASKSEKRGRDGVREGRRKKKHVFEMIWFADIYI